MFKFAIVIVTVVSCLVTDSALADCPADAASSKGCCGVTSQSWSHPPTAALQTSTATLTCLADGQVQLVIDSDPKLVSLEAQYISRAGQPSDNAACRDANVFTYSASSNTGQPVVIPQDPVTEPSVVVATMGEIDYDNYPLSASRPRRQATYSRRYKYAYTLAADSQKTCGFEVKQRANADATDCSNNVPQSEQFSKEGWVQVTERFYFDGVVEIVSSRRVHLTCNSYVVQPEPATIASGGIILPGQPSAIARCRSVDFQLEGTSANNNLLSTIRHVNYPTNERLAAWLVDQFHYNADALIERSTPNALFAALNGQISPANGLDNAQYQITTDNLAFPSGQGGHTLGLSAGVGFCLPNAPDSTVGICNDMPRQGMC